MLNHTRPTRIVLVGDEGNGDEFNAMLLQAKELHYELCHVHDVDDIVSSNIDFDVILIDLSRWASIGLALLGRVCESCPSVPVVVTVWKGADVVRQQALRMGARKALDKDTLTGATLAEAVRIVTGREADELQREQERLLEQALSFLQQHPVITDATHDAQPAGVKPLCEVMPYKFLELTKSYSNLLDLALTRAHSGVRFSGYSISRRLHFLASDLGSLHAGVCDVIDIHAKAVETEIGRNEANNASHKILLELISDLVSYYRHSEYANA